MVNDETLSFDIIIIGGGPAGLAASIRLAQLSEQAQLSLSICLIEKAADMGAHSISGAVFSSRALDELLPSWKEQKLCALTPVSQDQFFYLQKHAAIRLPTPPQMKNHGNSIISLSELCRGLSREAEQLGIQVFSGFAATELLFDHEQVCGVRIGDKGKDRLGKPKGNYQAGMDLLAKHILLAEGCRGSLSQQFIARFNLNQEADPQTYGLGIKEVWEVPEKNHQAGLVMHSVGWPLSTDTYGGSFVYHWGTRFISLGFVVGLDYPNPYLNPYEEFQRFKTHPKIKPMLEQGTRIAYGARTLIEGGIQSLPKLGAGGALIIGDAAGFLNVAKIKGIHLAMKSGMIAAESLIYHLQHPQTCSLSDRYTQAIKNSWIWEELYPIRNIRPAFQYGLLAGLSYAAIDTYLFRGHTPWTLHHRKADHTRLIKAKDAQVISYPKHDHQISFDLASSVYLANITAEDNQPNHLHLSNLNTPIEVNYKDYAAPETRYCPAGVYEIVLNKDNQPQLQINHSNCIHCKACDIKDPTQNIVWTPPEGGSGPNYGSM